MAAGGTYTKIASTTVGTAASSVTFSSIPSTYTDLVVVIQAAVTTGTSFLLWQVNGDTASNYPYCNMYGNGTSAVSARSTQSYARAGSDNFILDTTLGSSMAKINFMNYSNTTTYKTMVIRADKASYETAATIVTWYGTSAISSIVFSANTINFAVGSTFTIYGIAAA
jgi:hypothetical protein